MKLTSLDLNLLVVLRALLQEKHVTRAGRAVGLSQPATSAALARLRRHFGDELLVRVGQRYELTPLGMSLLDQVDSACELLERLFSARQGFDPATARRTFTLLTSDYSIAVLGEELIRITSREAPGVRLCLRQLGSLDVADLDTALRSVDGVLLPQGFISGYPSIHLYADRWMCLVSADNPAAHGEMQVEELAKMPWVTYYGRRTATIPAFTQLGLLGIEPRIDVVVESFQALPFLVAGTERVALIQERLARRYEGVTAVRAVDCPLDLPPLNEMMWWHPMHTRDPGHVWLREILVRSGSHL